MKSPEMLAVPPDCEKVPSCVPLPKFTKSAVNVPELRLTLPPMPLKPTYKPEVTIKAPPLILIVPPALYRLAFAVTVLFPVEKAPPETLNGTQKLSSTVTGPLAVMVPLVFIKDKSSNEDGNGPVLIVLFIPDICTSERLV